MKKTKHWCYNCGHGKQYHHFHDDDDTEFIGCYAMTKDTYGCDCPGFEPGGLPNQVHRGGLKGQTQGLGKLIDEIESRGL